MVFGMFAKKKVRDEFCYDAAFPRCRVKQPKARGQLRSGKKLGPLNTTESGAFSLNLASFTVLLFTFIKRDGLATTRFLAVQEKRTNSKKSV